MKKFHAAINYIPENGRNILCRLKELGTNSPTLKLDRSVFGEVGPTKGENFTIEVEGLAQSGNYLLAVGNCKVAEREAQAAVPFDVDAYMASLTEGGAPDEKDAPF